MFDKMLHNAVKLVNIAKENSNALAPHDKGYLKQSARVEIDGNVYAVTWYVVGKMPKKPKSRNSQAKYPYNYAIARYFVNHKNPQTTRWIEKDLAKNEQKYIGILMEGVIAK